MTITKSIIFSLLVIGCLCNTSCISKKLTATHSTINKIKDTDGDGVNDADDKCPDIKGVAILAGCPDTDGDGIADNKDKCPEVAGQLRYQGCPVPDSDKDGINDEEDECPTVFGYARYKGCLIPDTDGDGVNDEEDKCINEYGPASNNGCPMMADTGTVVANQQLKDNLYPAIPTENLRRKKKLPNSLVVKRNHANTKLLLANKATYPIVNSTTTIPTQDSVLGNATIYISYHAALVVNQPATISVKLVPGKPTADASKQQKDQDENNRSFIQLNDSTASCMVQNLQAFQQIEVNTSYNQSAIELKPANVEPQRPDIEKGNNWQWQIKALADSADDTQITISVIGQKANGDVIPIAAHQLKMKPKLSHLDSSRTTSSKWLDGYAGHFLTGVAIVIGLLILITRKRRKGQPGSNANKPIT